MKKSVIAILTTSVILLSVIGQILNIQTVQAEDPTSWYMTVPGVLDTDTYWLYPFETADSLKIGFSKFGELINSADNVGLEYGEVDPFAPPAGSGLTAQVPKRMWLNGWLLNISYVHRTLGVRNVWAAALHSDSIVYGKDWLRVDFDDDYSTTRGYEDPRDQGYLIGTTPYPGVLYNGGRKTNGTCVTDPITVLYNGPREFVAVTTTTVYDHPLYLEEDPETDVALVKVIITIVFNKVKKEVILYKDVKSILAWKEGEKMKIEFSNRGEVDLGIESTGYGSYAHFYTEGEWELSGFPYNDTLRDGYGPEGLPTCYGADWELTQTEDPLDTEYPGFSAAGPYPQTEAPHSFDVAHAINDEAGYTWFAGFWPSLSDWSIDGWDQWWHSLHVEDPHYIDYRVPDDEPFIPFYIGEWDFVLYHTLDTQERIQFRGVTVYGLTDHHDAEDEDMGELYDNIPDREALYQLNEVFNPWDLRQAVHKKNTRWVEFTYGPSWVSDNKPVMDVSDEEWDQYCVFSERVIDLDSEELLNRYEGDYDFYVDEDGYAHITGLDSDIYYKILYSTDTEYADWGPFTFYDEWIGVDDLNDGFSAHDYMEFEDWLGAYHEMELWADFNIEALTELQIGDNFTLTGDIEYEGYDFKVFKEGNFETDLDFYLPWHHEDGNNYFSIDLYLLDIDWLIYPPSGLDLHMDILTFDLEYEIFVVYNGTDAQAGDTWNVTATFNVVPNDDYEGEAPIYGEHIPGRYEWGIVGRDAYSVDSAGLSLVSAAFKNKQVEYGLAGEDMHNPEVAAQMPWVMAKIGTGNTLSSYYYGGTDYRTALKDDWCTTWPITTSNMIGVGGPIANMLSYYGNDFTAGFFGLGQFTDYAAWENKIAAVSCWNKNSYASSNTTGYAVVSTYKDINGTVLFMIWGHWGRDTYYVTKWFHEEGIFQLQEAPLCLTSIIVEIDYESSAEGYKPTDFTIVECLGTISETEWYHGYAKGGIHDP